MHAVWSDPWESGWGSKLGKYKWHSVEVREGGGRRKRGDESGGRGWRRRREEGRREAGLGGAREVYEREEREKEKAGSR